MDDGQRIPEDAIVKPPGSTGDVGDPNDPLVIPGGTTDPTIELQLGGSDRYPDSPEVVDRVVVTSSDNVQTYQVFYKPPGSSSYVPLDLDGDGVADVRSHFVYFNYHKFQCEIHSEICMDTLFM